MNDSVFFLNPEQQSRLAVGHVGNQACWKPGNHPLPPWDMGDLLRPVAGMYSSMNDLLIFARANLGMLHLPVESALAATHREQIQTARGGEALGWIINDFDNGRRVLTFKDGMVAGYCAYIGLDLDAHVAVVVLSNKFSWDEKVGQNLAVAARRSFHCHPNPDSHVVFSPAMVFPKTLICADRVAANADAEKVDSPAGWTGSNRGRHPEWRSGETATAVPARWEPTDLTHLQNECSRSKSVGHCRTLFAEMVQHVSSRRRTNRCPAAAPAEIRQKWRIRQQHQIFHRLQARHLQTYSRAQRMADQDHRRLCRCAPALHRATFPARRFPAMAIEAQVRSGRRVKEPEIADSTTTDFRPCRGRAKRSREVCGTDSCDGKL